MPGPVKRWYRGNNLKGNEQRLMEMHEEGMKPHGISGAFRDQGINITPEQVQHRIESHEEMSRKPMPRSAVSAAIRGHRRAWDDELPDGTPA